MYEITESRHLNDGTFLFIENNKNYIMRINKTIDWRIEDKWSREPLDFIFSTYFFRKDDYQKFRI